MFVTTIRTPTDFEHTVGADDAVIHKWIAPTADIEPAIRRTIDDIFRDLEYIESDDRELIASYLESIYKPLQQLQRMGLQLVGMVMSGRRTFPAGTLGSETERSIEWRRSIYVVAPDPCFYRLASQAPVRVHKLGIDCEGARLLAAGDGGDVTFWGSLDLVERDYEGIVPWCDTCTLHVLQSD